MSNKDSLNFSEAVKTFEQQRKLRKTKDVGLGKSKIEPYANKGKTFSDKFGKDLATKPVLYVMQNLDSLGKFRIQPPAFRKTISSEDGKEKPFVFVHEDNMLADGVNLIIRTLDSADAPPKFYDLRLIFFIFANEIAGMKEIVSSLVPGYRPSRLLEYLTRLNNDLMKFMKSIGQRGTKLVNYSEFVNRNVDLTPIRLKKGEKRETKKIETPTARNTRVAVKPTTPAGKTPLQVLIWKVDEEKRKESEKLIQDFVNMGYDFSVIPFLAQSVWKDSPQDEEDQRLLKAKLRDMLTYYTLGNESRDKAEDAFGVNLQRWTFTSLMSNLDKVIKGKTYIKLSERDDVVNELKRQVKEDKPEEKPDWETDDVVAAFTSAIEDGNLNDGDTSIQYAYMDQAGNWKNLDNKSKDVMLQKFTVEKANSEKLIVVSYKGDEEPRMLVSLDTYMTTAVLKQDQQQAANSAVKSTKAVKQRNNGSS